MSEINKSLILRKTTKKITTIKTNNYKENNGSKLFLHLHSVLSLFVKREKSEKKSRRGELGMDIFLIILEKGTKIFMISK